MHPAKKSSNTGCAYTLYGYTGGSSYNSEFIFGPVNLSSATITSRAQFESNINNDGAAFNTADNCYYVFRQTAPDSLIKISLSGAITSINKSPSDGSNYVGVVYNPVVGSLYCIKDGNLATMAISGTSYSATTVLDGVAGISAIDNTNGAMYYQASSNDTFYVYQYSPQQATSSIVATVTGVYNIYGLQCNSSTHMLYAVRANEVAPYFDLVQINPSTGGITSISSLNYSNSPAYCSAVIDPCNNEYIFSVGGDVSGSGNSYFVDQYNLSGVLLQHTATTGMLEGLQEAK